MQFSKHDIIRLYGKQFFVVPTTDRVPETEAAPADQEIMPTEEPDFSDLLSGGMPVVWKMKPQARLALILPKADFADRALTTQLKAMIDQAGIDTRLIGFGVIDKEANRLDISDMPVSLGVMFHDMGLDSHREASVHGKKIYLAGALSTIVSNAAAKTELIQTLKEVNKAL